MNSYKKAQLTLRNGVQIPVIGLGTWEIPNNEVTEIVSDALAMGYRHIDTAQSYGNEEGIGKAIANSGINRKDLFICSKIDASIKTYKEAKQSIDDSLKKLGVEYLDLMLIHCPTPWNDFAGSKNYDVENLEVWRALENAYKDKKIRAIGVSNFNIHDLTNILDNCVVKPMVNQILVHVGFTPLRLLDFCKRNKIVVEAYSPLAHGHLKEDVKVKDISELHRISCEELAIKYTLDIGLVTLPKSTTKEHLAKNLNYKFRLKEEDRVLLASFDRFYPTGSFYDKLDIYYNSK